MEIPIHLQEKVQKIHQFSFDIFELESEALDQCFRLVAYEVINHYGFMDAFNINTRSMKNFIDYIERGYSYQINPFEGKITYHLLHAADVIVAAYHMLKFGNMKEHFSDVEKFSLIFAAIIHDYIHPDDAKKIEEKLDFKAYEDPNVISIYKRNLVDKVFKYMRKYDCDITKGLTPDQLIEFTKLVKMLVVATNEQHHFKYFNELKVFLTENKGAKLENATTMRWLFLCADHSQLSKEWNVYSKWTERVPEKFHRKKEIREIYEIEIIEREFNLLSDLLDLYNTKLI